ncbi:peptidylprolyl isomerase [Candidatus Peregrinibacteria bacterium]|nr:peptidylprolyl isomerase [Candidatus Peregrinibacteria bacterium]
MKTLFSIFLASALLLLAGCSKTSEEDISNYQGSPETFNATKNEVMKTFDQTILPHEGESIVVMETSMGTIKIQLFPEYAPKTVENFTGLIDKGYYDGLIFHRVIPNFMIQGGDPEGTGRGGESLWGGKFEDEFSPNLRNIRGALSMANSGPDTNGSQFFIVQQEGGTPWLNDRHSVFGQVFEGMDIVDAIANVDRDPADKPLEKVVMTKVYLENYQPETTNEES